MPYIITLQDTSCRSILSFRATRRRWYVAHSLPDGALLLLAPAAVAYASVCAKNLVRSSPAHDADAGNRQKNCPYPGIAGRSPYRRWRRRRVGCSPGNRVDLPAPSAHMAYSRAGHGPSPHSHNRVICTYVAQICAEYTHHLRRVAVSGQAGHDEPLLRCR